MNEQSIGNGKDNTGNNDNTIVYSPKSVAEILEVKESFVKRLLRDGKLKGFKLGKFWRIPKASLDEFCGTCNSNGNGNGKVAEDTRNKIQFHATLRSQDTIPTHLQVMEEKINNIKAKIQAEDGFKKIASIAKLQAVVAAREEKKQKLESMAADLNELVDKAYPGLRALVDQNPDALEAYFIQGEEEEAQAKHPLARVMQVGNV